MRTSRPTLQCRRHADRKDRTLARPQASLARGDLVILPAFEPAESAEFDMEPDQVRRSSWPVASPNFGAQRVSASTLLYAGFGVAAWPDIRSKWMQPYSAAGFCFDWAPCFSMAAASAAKETIATQQIGQLLTPQSCSLLRRRRGTCRRRMWCGGASPTSPRGWPSRRRPSQVRRRSRRDGHHMNPPAPTQHSQLMLSRLCVDLRLLACCIHCHSEAFALQARLSSLHCQWRRQQAGRGLDVARRCGPVASACQAGARHYSS